MKKLVLFAVAIVAVSVISCGNKKAETAEPQTVVEQVQTEVQAVSDSVVNTVDSLATQAQDAVK